MVLPILILNVLGPEESAYYYMAMMLATFLLLFQRPRPSHYSPRPPTLMPEWLK